AGLSGRVASRRAPSDRREGGEAVRTADRAFGLLVLLALGSSALLVALLAALLPQGFALASGGVADMSSVVALLVLILATFVMARSFAAGLYVVPVVEELVEYYTVQKEVAADQAAVRAIGGVRDLASALFKVLPDADDVDLGLLVPVGSLSVTEARIEQLVDGRSVPLALSRVSV